MQAYNFAIEERLFEEYGKMVDYWRGLPITQIIPLTLTTWQEEWVGWAAEEYVKSDPTIAVYEAETAFLHTSGQITTSNTITAWQFSQDGYMCLSSAHDFAGPTIVEVIARGTPDDGDWPGMKVWISDTLPITLTEVGGETGIDYTVVVSLAHATNKAKSVSDDLISTTTRFALYRYRTTYTNTSKLCIEVVSTTVTATVDIDKVLLRTEPRSVEMYEVEKDWDGKSDTQVEIGDFTVLLTDTEGYIDIYHYAWGVPLTVQVVARGYSTNPSPVISVTCNSFVWTTTLTTEYVTYAFDWDPGSEGMVTCRIQTGNYKDVRVDKLLVKESLLVLTNTAPVGYFVVDSTVSGPTMTITATAVVTDPDGDAIASYLWDFGDRKSYCSGNPTVTHIYTVTQVPHCLILRATDHRGKTSVFLQILSNHAPEANAGKDQIVDTNTLVTLDGSDSDDPDGDLPLTYYWTQTGGPAVTLSDPAVVTPTFTVPGDPAVLTFTLVVTDSLGLPDSTPDEVVITVNNRPPVADAGGDQGVDTGETVTLDGSGSDDPDGDLPLTYYWTQTGGPPVTLSDPTVVTPTFTVPGDPAVLTFTLVVTDSLGLPDPTPDEVVVTVTNRAPEANAGKDQIVDTNTLVTLDGSDSDDPDGDLPLTYYWTQTGGPTVTLSDPAVVTPTFTALGDPAVLTFTLAVTDSLGLPDPTPDEVVVTVTNRAPEANAGKDQIVDTNTLVTLDGSDSDDPDGDLPLTYYWTQTGGPTVTLSDPAVVSPTFTAPGDPAVLTFTLVVTDSLGLPDPTPDGVGITVEWHRICLPLVLNITGNSSVIIEQQPSTAALTPPNSRSDALMHCRCCTVR